MRTEAHTTTDEKNMNEINKAFEEVVRSRRAVRNFDKSPVADGVIQRALEMAILAPSSSNLQYGEFYWVRNPEQKKRLAEACFSQPAATTAQELVVLVGRKNTWKRNAKFNLGQLENNKAPKSAQDYYRKLMPLMYTRGPLRIAHLLRRIGFTIRGFFAPAPRGPYSEADMRVLAATNAALAAENFMLSIRAQGYDSCPMGGFDARRVEKILKLPKDAEITMIFAVGKGTKEGVYGPRLRLPYSQLVHIVD